MRTTRKITVDGIREHNNKAKTTEQELNKASKFFGDQSQEVNAKLRQISEWEREFGNIKRQLAEAIGENGKVKNVIDTKQEVIEQKEITKNQLLD